MIVKRTLEIYLVRHGLTEANEKGVFQGQMEYSLSKTGKQQCRLLTQRLQQEKITFTALFSSRLVRAIETAAIISTGLGIKVVPLPGLEECCLGAIQGLTVEQVRCRYPGLWEHARASSWGDAAPGGEPRRQLLERVNRAIAGLESVLPDGSGPVLLVTHTSVIKAILAGVSGLSAAQPWPYICNNASLTIIKFDDGRPEIRLLNDCCHLRPMQGGYHGECAGIH